MHHIPRQALPDVETVAEKASLLSQTGIQENLADFQEARRTLNIKNNNTTADLGRDV